MRSTIPFQGFYGSAHEGLLDDALDQIFQDDNGEPIGELVAGASDLVDWRAVFTAYARRYTEAFVDHIALAGVTFIELHSPREYNFTTDRIFVDIPETEVRRMRQELPQERFKAAAKERFTSRSGFISFYDPDVDNWGPLETWDANQVGTLVAAYFDVNATIDDEWELMESDRDNSVLENLITSAVPEAKRPQLQELFAELDKILNRPAVTIKVFAPEGVKVRVEHFRSDSN